MGYLHDIAYLLLTKLSTCLNPSRIRRYFITDPQPIHAMNFLSRAETKLSVNVRPVTGQVGYVKTPGNAMMIIESLAMSVLHCSCPARVVFERTRHSKR